MRVECHPHRGKVVKHIPESVSIRECKPGAHVFYRDAALLVNVEFNVQPAGPERVNKNGVRDVHAFARGNLLGVGIGSSNAFFEYATRDRFGIARYNPFVKPYFYDSDLRARVENAWMVLITGGVCYYIPNQAPRF